LGCYGTANNTTRLEGFVTVNDENSQAKLDGNLELIFAIAAKVDTMI